MIPIYYAIYTYNFSGTSTTTIQFEHDGLNYYWNQDSLSYDVARQRNTPTRKEHLVNIKGLYKLAKLQNNPIFVKYLEIAKKS